MLMNYHEMTMSEPRDSPARRKQFLVICTVMVAALVHSIVGAGAFVPVTIEEGFFPGGEFIYKETKRDYAASGSLEQSIGKHDLGLKLTQYVDNLYSLYLDDPNKMGGRRQRFMSGLLVGPDSEYHDKIDVLMATNEGRVPPTEDELLSDGALELWPKLEYKEARLPKVKAAIVQFAYTGGFVSSFVNSMKIMPAMRKYAKEHNGGSNNIVVMTTCSYSDQMCTHYAPLAEGETFLLGHPDTEKYMEELGPEEFLSTKKTSSTLRMLWKRVDGLFATAKGFLGGSSSKTTTESTSIKDAPPKPVKVAEERIVKEMKPEAEEIKEDETEEPHPQEEVVQQDEPQVEEPKVEDEPRAEEIKQEDTQLEDAEGDDSSSSKTDEL